MIIVQLLGGLGNQMFQYAVGRYLSISYNTDLYIDLSKLEAKVDIPEFTPRNYELDIFNLPINIISEKEINKFYLMPKNLYERIIGKIYRKLLMFNVVYENNPKFTEILKAGRNCYLIGYWQNIKYFEPIESILRNDFIFRINLDESENNILREIQSENSVSLHIRRGDYVKFDSLKNYYYQCNLDYYLNSVSFLKSKFRDLKFYIFSDEPEWVRDNLHIDVDYKIVNHDKVGLDLFLMSQCKHNIIANSTYSWWGAWLNNNPEKIVIAPSKWYNLKDYSPVLNSWIKF